MVHEMTRWSLDVLDGDDVACRVEWEMGQTREVRTLTEGQICEGDDGTRGKLGVERRRVGRRRRGCVPR